MKTSDVNCIIDNLTNQLANSVDTVSTPRMGWHGLELSEGRVYGALYLTVHPNNGSRWNEMMAWMISIFGPSGTPKNPGIWSPDQRWYANNAKFWFRDKQDLEWFMLRWS